MDSWDLEPFLSSSGADCILMCSTPTSQLCKEIQEMEIEYSQTPNVGQAIEYMSNLPQHEGQGH